MTSPAENQEDPTTQPDAAAARVSPISVGTEMPSDQPELLGSAVTGVPTLDEVQERIERRYGLALGTAELAGESESVAEFDKKKARDEQAAKDKLDAIRRSLHPQG